MKERFEDEIPTRPGVKHPHSDLDYSVGLLLSEAVNLKKRIEVLEALAIGKKTQAKRESDRPGPSVSEMASLAKSTIKWAILIIAGIVSALKELGFLKP
jgi:hypothetical protein